MLHSAHSRLLSLVTQFSLLIGRLSSRSFSRRRRMIVFPALALAALLIVLASLLTPLTWPARSGSGASSSLSAQAPAAPSLLVAADALPSLHAHAQWSVALRFVRGYSVQGSWLCYGWPSGAYHCTQHWRGTSGHYVSLNPSWVPSQVSSSQPIASAPLSFSAAPLHISQWASTGRPASTEPYGTFQGYSWGWCTSGAALLAHDNVRGLGNALDWTRNAAARGMPTGYTPAVGATVVFQPYVQGAGGGGHVAHVVAVYGGGWFMVEESNFVWNGGGFGRLSFRYAHTGPGVSFIL